MQGVEEALSETVDMGYFAANNGMKHTFFVLSRWH